MLSVFPLLYRYTCQPLYTVHCVNFLAYHNNHIPLDVMRTFPIFYSLSAPMMSDHINTDLDE